MNNISLGPWITAAAIRDASIRMLALALIIATFATSSFATSFFWVGGGADASNPANGIWDTTTMDWSTTSNGVANTAFTSGQANPTTLGGGGTYTVIVGASVGPGLPLHISGNYTFSATAAKNVSINNASSSGSVGAANPDLVIDSGKTATVGNNVTFRQNGPFVMGATNGFAGGTLIIESGGILQEENASTFAICGIGTTVSVRTNGIFRHSNTSTTTARPLGIGVAAGDSVTFNVDGGTVSNASTINGIILGNGNGSGTLNINNNGLVSLPAASIAALVVGNTGANVQTNMVNLNGGALVVPQVISSNTVGTSIFNFNGGTLKAVNATYASTFLNGLTAVNVRDGGAVIDNNGFNLTIGQALLHSAIAGDSATDGGLVLTSSSSAGSLTLTNANTYNGDTVVNAGSLVLSSSGSISNTAGMVVAGGAMFDVSALSSFKLGSSQTLSNSSSTATLNGNVNASVGKVSLAYVSGTPSFAVTNGTLTLSSSTTFVVNNTGAALPAGNYKLIDANTGGLVAGALPAVTVSGGGVVSGATAALQISSSDLYLIVSGGIFGIDSSAAASSISGFNAAFLTIYNSGNSAAYITALNDTSRDYFWSQAEDIQGEENVFEHTGNSADQTLVNKLCTTLLVNWTPPWTWNPWNDDVGRVSQALVRGYQMTGVANFLTQAEYGFNLVYNRGWDTNFNGGGIYEEMGVANPRKETLSTATTGHAAAMIYQNGGGATYLTQAVQIYGWLRTNLFNTTSGAVYTGVYTNGTLDTATQIYNQGLFIDYANCLYEITGNSMYFNDANLAVQYTQLHLTSNGILPSAAGEFVRGMGHFVTYNNLWSTYYSWMEANANAAWSCRRTDLNIAWNIWTTQTPMTNNLTPLECLGVVGMLQFIPATQPGFVACTNQLNGTVIGSAPGGGNTIANVFDGNLTTYFFAASSSGAWVGLDLGTSNVIGQISYCPRPNFASLMIGGIFQGDNNSSFSTPVTLYTITTVPPQYMMTPVTITNQTAFRYVRYVGPSGANCNVAELQFFAANPVLLNVQWSNSVMQLTWNGNGKLLQATNLLGPWTTNTGAVSPFQVTPTVPQQFFRVQGQ